MIPIKKSTKVLTRKNLMAETGAKPFIIQYLTETKRLPLIRAADGAGSVNLYAPEAIQILKDWISRGGDYQDE
jgi:hypothetical protein